MHAADRKTTTLYLFLRSFTVISMIMLTIKIKWRNIDIRSVAKRSQLLLNIQQIWSSKLLIKFIKPAFKILRRSTFYFKSESCP